MEEKPNPTPDVISFDDFLKVDIRVGLIKSAERVPKSDKLLKLQVDFGVLGQRQILAGIGKRYNPETIVGQRAAFVVNLAPRKMMGLESNGMILAGENAMPEEDGEISIAFLPTAFMVGARLG